VSGLSLFAPSAVQQVNRLAFCPQGSVRQQKKIARTEGVSFLRFQNWIRGRGAGLYAVFPDRRAISLLFFPRGANT
jgi:hypothetical protein